MRLAERFGGWPLTGQPPRTAGQVMVLVEALRDVSDKPKTQRDRLKRQPRLPKAKLAEIARRRDPGVKSSSDEK